MRPQLTSASLPRTERQALQTPAARARCATEASCGMTSATALTGKGIRTGPKKKEFSRRPGSTKRRTSDFMPEPTKSAEYLASLMMGSGCDGGSLKANRTTEESAPVCSPSFRTIHRFF